MSPSKATCEDAAQSEKELLKGILYRCNKHGGSRAAVRKRDEERQREKACNSGKACILSLCLAACVININSTKWAVIKLSRVVNDPQRQNWNIKEHKLVRTSTDMQPNIHFQYVYVSCMYPLPPPPPSHSNTHIGDF